MSLLCCCILRKSLSTADQKRRPPDESFTIDPQAFQKRVGGLAEVAYLHLMSLIPGNILYGRQSPKSFCHCFGSPKSLIAER